ncbi:hypothetical protein BDZ94DRAFT_1271088 [Collybia nuda]|uniref:CCHC-type domain-containing protein n=1 Tax=Collybia nuda TaxID=64659 RepID=A0A9P5XXA6_9AGAR|nr:hypothetical protein BDZ94DRAFT_1271088 [Collybia nuda]
MEREWIKDPPTISHKGRPQGGGAGIRTQAFQENKRRRISCRVCREEGHNRSTCPFRV